MATFMDKQDSTNNPEMIVGNENESSTLVAERSKVRENRTALNQYTEHPATATAETSIGNIYKLMETEESKCLTKKDDSKSEMNEKEDCKSEYRDKDVGLDKDQTNNKVKNRNISLENNKEQSKAGDKDKNRSMFKKKKGTAQVSGQLYETNMLSFIYLKVTFDQDIIKFYLASNIDGIGALDDICFRFKSNENDKDVLVLIQTKHRNRISEKTNITMNDMLKSDGDFSITKYFDSSIKIRAKVTSKKIQNYLFEGNKLDCYFIIYTPAGHSINDSNIKLGKPNSKVNALIETGNDGVVFQLKYEKVGFLLHDLIEKRFEELAKKFLDIILNGNLNMVNDELVESYRVVLLHYVIDISEDVSEGTYSGKFQSEFFENNEKYTSMFREKLYNEVIKNKLNGFKEDKENMLSTHEGSTAKKVVKNIGNIIRYDEKNNHFILIENSFLSCDLLDQTKEETKFTSAKDVVEIAAQEILKYLEFKIPFEFIYKDMKITTSRRLNLLTSSLIELFENAKDQNGVQLIEIDENMLDANKINGSVFDQNGGFGSAVGNLLIIDQESNTFNFNNDNLPPNAKKLWENLNLEENLMQIKEDLTSYRFKVCNQGFPKVSIEDVASDEYLVKDFLSKLWFYTRQAKHDIVEDKSKKMIKDYLKADLIPKSIFEVSPNAVYLTLHKKIEKWWESEKEKDFLSESTNILKDAISKLANNPILTVLNLFCVSTLKVIGIEFLEDAIKSLNIDEFTSGLLMVITDSTTMTGTKIKQHFKDSHDHRFINMNDVVNHFLISFDKILYELESKTIRTIIIICETMENIRYTIQALKRFKEKMHCRKIIIVSNKKTHEEINKEIMCIDVRNDTSSLYDLTMESQEKVLNESVVVFQGVEVNLKTIIDSNSKHIITSHILNKLVMKEVIELGNVVTTSNYDEIRQFYVHRTLECPGEDEDLHEAATSEACSSKQSKHHSNDKIVIDTKNLLIGLKDEMMVITAPPGMGKSTLLTYLSEETKKEYPNMWIVRINLQDYSKQFYEWKQKKTVIDETMTLNFLCQAVTKGNSIENNEFAVNDSLELGYFLHCCKTGNVIFLFDGFDEICPHYESVVIQLIKSTRKLNLIESANSSAVVIKKAKIWIASRSYNDVLQSIEREFGKSYNLEPISDLQQRIYLKAFWKEHLKLNKFTKEQLTNVKCFIDYMANFIHNLRERTNFSFYIKPISFPLYDMYAIAIDFFLNEISSIPDLVNNEMFESTLNLDGNLFKEYKKLKTKGDVKQASILAGTPLHLYIAADFFQNEIKYSHSINQPNKWNLDMNTFSFYDSFLRTKFTKIRFEEKNKMDVYIPDNEMTHENAYSNFVEKHQILAFYAIFNNNESYFKAVTTKNERDYIRVLIDCIKLAKEKTGVIECVVDDVPIFIHRTFAEYFAVQHVINILKTAYSHKDFERQEAIWNFILDAVMRDGSEDTNSIFDYKLANDDKLSNIIRNEDTERIVYNILSGQIKTILPDQEDTAINKVVYCGLRETTKFLFTCIGKHMKEDFFDRFYDYARKTSIVEYTYILGYDDVHHSIRNILKMDYEMVQTILSRYIWMARDFKFGPFKK